MSRTAYSLPKGAMSKDGSAGAAITTAIYSLINQKNKNDVAITGEITLMDVTAIGGLDIKLSGIRNGKKILISKGKP